MSSVSSAVKSSRKLVQSAGQRAPDSLRSGKSTRQGTRPATRPSGSSSKAPSQDALKAKEEEYRYLKY